jgi:outer membrane protein TolC
MKIEYKILVTALAVSVGLLAWPIAVGETPEANQTQQLDELLKQRQATLRQLIEVVTKEYRNGVSGFEPVIRATDQLIDADLEMAKNSKDRVAILQRRVELMKEFFAGVSTKYKAGVATQSESIAAQAELLNAKIQLAREQTDGGEPEQ